MNLPPSKKYYGVQISTARVFPFLYMNMIWYPNWVLHFIIFSKKGQNLKYVIKGITHTPGTLHMILSEVLNRQAKITLRKPDISYKRVDSIYLKHNNILCEACLVPSIFLKIGELWKYLYGK